jgi:hypothetical protein
MTPPKQFQYRIQYVDNTYQMVDWTKPEFNSAFTAMAEDKKVLKVSDGIFRLDHIRTIVLIPPLPEPTEEEKKVIEEENKLSEWGFVDDASALWLKEVGIDLGKGAN